MLETVNSRPEQEGEDWDSLFTLVTDSFLPPAASTHSLSCSATLLEAPLP